jgi:hypothetical protein
MPARADEARCALSVHNGCSGGRRINTGWCSGPKSLPRSLHSRGLRGVVPRPRRGRLLAVMQVGFDNTHASRPSPAAIRLSSRRTSQRLGPVSDVASASCSASGKLNTTRC